LKILICSEIVEFEYRLFIDKQEICQNEKVTAFIQEHIPNIVLERESVSEMVYGIRRTDSKQIGQLVRALDEQSQQIGVDSYGLSMTTIEEVFLK
jgi:ATP-binding cassette subfamily A (ABC1) protein 3